MFQQDRSLNPNILTHLISLTLNPLNARPERVAAKQTILLLSVAW